MIVAASFAIMFFPFLFSKKDKGRTVEIVNETWICQIARLFYGQKDGFLALCFSNQKINQNQIKKY